MSKKTIRIGFDLDGVIIGKPPFIPKKLIEWFYRGRINQKLSYRYPGKIEKFIRWLSHYYLLRPPLKNNSKFLKLLFENKNVEIYAITGRYGFLHKRTKMWLKKNGIAKVFKRVYINSKDEQPHKFKEKTIKDLKLDFFIEDDPLIIKFLKKNVVKTNILSVKKAVVKLRPLLRLKVLIGISYYLPNISGLTIYAQNLAEELVKKGHVVKIITSKHLKKLSEKEIVNGVVVKRIWTPFIFGRGPIMPSFPIKALKEVQNADVVNIHIPQFEGVCLAFWARLLGKKIVLTHHCDLSNWSGLINQITEKITYFSLLITGFLADKIVVYTRDYADHSSYLRLFRNKLEYILPPVKTEKPKGKLKKKYKNIKYKIGFAGRISKEKGLENLAKTIPQLKKKLGENFKIFLTGPYKEIVGGANLSELDNLIKKYKKYIELLGSFNAKQMADFYQMIDCLVLPSIERLESFGFVQVEAMLLGSPVIASNLPGVRMPTKLSGMGCTAKMGNSGDLAKKIVTVLKNKKKFVKPKLQVKKIFDFQKTIDAYEDLYKNLL